MKIYVAATCFFSCNTQSVDLEDICFPEMYIHRLCLLYTYVGRMSKLVNFTG